MKITLKNRLLIVAVVLIAVSLTSSVVSYQSGLSINRNILQVLEIEEPLEETLLEMEINTVETSRAVLEYIQDNDEEKIASLLRSELEFQRFAIDYLDLADTQQLTAIGHSINASYIEFSSLGHEVIILQDHQTEKLLSLREKVNIIMYSFKSLAQLNDDSPRPESLPHMVSLFGMANLVAEIHTDVEGVIAKQNPSFEFNLTYYSDSFHDAYITYRSTLFSPTEAEALDQIYQEFQIILETSSELIETTDELTHLLGRFEDKLEEIDLILDEEIQPLVNERTVAATQNAMSASTLALRTSLFNSIFGSTVIGVLLYGLSKWIISPIFLIIEGIERYSEGSLVEPIQVSSDDEIGQLSDAFNQMTVEIDEKIETIRKNERALEQLNVNLEAEMKARKESEEEIVRIAGEAELDKVRSHFLSTITHELRTPLTSIKGYVDLVRSGMIVDIPKEADELLEVVDRNSNRLMNLTDDLLDIQRLATGRLQVDLQPLDLQGLLRNVEEEIKPFIDSKNQKLVVEQPETPLLVNGDQIRLSQVLMNILNNASKFTPEDETIKMRAIKDEKVIRITIVDKGIGIKEEDIPRVFEPLAMIEKPIHVKGTGLGLSVSQGIIELHGGSIIAESEGEWKGATFTIILPIKEDD